MDTPKSPAAPLLPGQQNFRVTQGEESRTIPAANRREALRRFENDDQRVEAELVKGDEKVPGLLPASTATNPEKRRYRVTWGDQWEREVTAVSKDDAWSQAVGGKTDTQEWRYPNLYERIVEDLGPADDSAEVAQAQGSESQESEVADDNADDAKDKISRMRSVEKLRGIAASDPRVSVRTAAEDRIKELEGSE